MSLYAECMAERYGYEVIEDENGFISFYFENEVCKAFEIFVTKKRRGTEQWRFLWERLKARCKDKGINKIVGFVDISKEEPEKRLIAYVRHGAKIKDLQEKIIIIEWSI